MRRRPPPSPAAASLCLCARPSAGRLPCTTADSTPQSPPQSLVRVRLKIIRNELIKTVCKCQSCMVSKLRIIFKRTRMHFLRNGLMYIEINQCKHCCQEGTQGVLQLLWTVPAAVVCCSFCALSFARYCPSPCPASRATASLSTAMPLPAALRKIKKIIDRER